VTLPSVAFVACIENNKTAPEALLLFSSIRKFGGIFSEAPIYSFNPRGGAPLEPSHYGQLRALNVRHSDKILNTAYPDYGPANKIVSAEYAEKTCEEDILVFADSDSVFLNEPRALDLPTGVIAGAVPVWLPGIASLGLDDPAQIFWDRARKVCGVKSDPPHLHARLTGQQMSFYCNAGLIVVRRAAGLFSQWLRCFVTLRSDSSLTEMLTCDSAPGTGYGPEFFVEQVAIAIALMPVASNMMLFDHRYNCPLHNRPMLQHVFPAEVFDLNTIIHFHYNQALHQVGFLESFIPPLDPTSVQYAWLAPQLPLSPKVPPPATHQDFATTFDRRMHQWREALRRGFAGDRGQAGY
jgi:hypothetical protein